MAVSKKPVHVSKLIPRAVKTIAGSKVARGPDVVKSLSRQPANRAVDNWLTYDTQARVMALAAESNRDVKSILSLAVSVYSATVHVGAKHPERFARRTKER